jgi:ClpP class serine protease
VTAARRYVPTSPFLAIDAAAIGILFEPPPPPAVEMRDGVAIVPIRGVMNSHEGPGAVDNYDAIRRRLEQALAHEPKAVVLAIDSPGGMVAGCMELAEEMRSMCAAAGVPLESYVDGQATSAAYALACAGAAITIPPTGIVGSIGTITELVDTTALDAAMGLRFHVLASGERKTDGNPHSKISDVALKVVAGQLTELSETLFKFVATHRPITVDEVRALEAGKLIGAKAERAGLADHVGTLSSLVARLSGKTSAARASDATPTEESTMTEEEKARASLKAIADDEKSDAKAKARAVAALKAMDEEPSDEDKDKEAKAKADADAKAKAETEPPKKPEDKKDEGAQALALARETRALVDGDRRARAVSELLAGRPDLTAEQRTAFSALEPAALEGILKTIPRGVTPLPAGAASSAVRPILGKGQGGPQGASPAAGDPVLSAMDRAFGLDARGPGVRRDDAGSLTFSMITHAEAEELSKKGGPQ